MNVFDTDLLISVLRKSPEAENAVDRLSGQHNAVTVITQLELWRGALKSNRNDAISAVNRVVSLFEVLPFASDSAVRTAEIWTALEKERRPIELRDLMIAGICLEQDATLYTRNLRHFERVPGLKVKRW